MLRNMEMEFEEILQVIEDNDSQFLFLGIGNTSDEFYEYSHTTINIIGFLDNDVKKQGTVFHNINIKGIDSSILGKKIIITSNAYYKELKKQLIGLGLHFNKDFFYYRDMVPFISYKKNKEVWLDQVDITITLRCTLNCIDCCLGMPYVRDKVDLELEDIKRDIHDFFDIYDGVRNFVLVGGEPLLYEHLVELIEFLTKYKPKIGTIKLITNGTLLPNPEILSAIASAGIQVHISDYGKYSIKKEALITKLKEMKVGYQVLRNLIWSDYGDFHAPRNLSEHDLINLYQECAMPCRTLWDGKLWFCSRECAIIRMKAAGAFTTDYLPLIIKNVDKLDLIKFDFGCNPKGYINFCTHCQGSWIVNKNLIPSARQLRR